MTWTSKHLYEHPAPHQAGTYGNVHRSDAGVYVLQVGSSRMSCPQPWAAGIHAEETGTPTRRFMLRQIPDDLHHRLKVLSAQRGLSTESLIMEILSEYVSRQA